MNDRIKKAFDQVQAGEELKEKTRTFLAQKTGGYAKRREIRCQPLAAAVLCLVFLVLGGHWFYFIPTAKISIDVNPSIELGINRFDRVVVVESYNEDGKELTASLDIRFKRYEEAVRQILESERIAALLSQDEVLTITVMESRGPQSVRIFSDMESCAAKHQNTYCYFADSRTVAPAHEHGMSCGKYRAFLELQKLCPDITPEEIQGMTMRQIWDLTDKMAGDGGENTSLEADEREDWGTGDGESERGQQACKDGPEGRLTGEDGPEEEKAEEEKAEEGEGKAWSGKHRGRGHHGGSRHGTEH